MQERHIDRQKYFNEQAYTTEKYVIPFIKTAISINENTSVLEIGCGEGGNLKPFADIGCEIVGIDILQGKIDNAIKFFSGHKNENKIKFIAEDIYNEGVITQKFDLIIMRDVIEHIHDQERFLNYVKRFLKPTGKFFLGFPPWQNPFGGHQQMCKSKTLSLTPYWHMLPMFMYKSIMKLFGEKETTIEGLAEIKDTRISIERFKRIVKRENYKIDEVKFYFINPNYEMKFNLKVREQSKLISSIPYFRNFTITTCYYVISLD